MARRCATNVDDQVFRKFKQLIIAKHGTLRGHMGEALTEAMQLWINMEEGKAKREANKR